MSKFLCLLFLYVPLIAAQTPGPAGTPQFGLHDKIFVVRLLSPLSTKTGHEGDIFTASVEEPKELSGAVVVGRVTKMKKPEKGTGKGKAEIQFQFESLTFNNQTENIRAELTAVKNSQGKEKVDEEGHVIGVSSNKKRIIAGILGGLAGTAAGAAVAGSRGAGVGGAAGAALGLLLALKMTTAATDIEFKPGSLFTLRISDAIDR